MITLVTSTDKGADHIELIFPDLEPVVEVSASVLIRNFPTKRNISGSTPLG